MVKLLLLLADPPNVATVTKPVVVPGITIAVTDVPVLLIVIAGTPPMLTTGLLKAVPVMVTRLPTGPLSGLKDIKVGGSTVAS